MGREMNDEARVPAPQSTLEPRLDFDLKIMLDDVRARQLALMNLIQFNSAQAMTLFRLYITTATAATAGAVAAAERSGEGTSYYYLSFALGAVVLTFILGCLFAFNAMRPADLALPGRGADFWRTALGKNLPPEETLNTYLSQLEKRQTEDRKTNNRDGTMLRNAKVTGVMAPPAALLGILVGYLFQRVAPMFQGVF
jgi:hypothetical protein